MEKRKTRILLADDNPDMRSALTLLLETRLNVVVVGEVSSMDELKSEIERMWPDLIILDWELPGGPQQFRIETLRGLKRWLKIVVTSARPETAEMVTLADGFVLKTEPPEKLLEVLNEVVAAGDLP